MKANKKRIEGAQSVPYWVRDNYGYFNGKSRERINTEGGRAAFDAVALKVGNTHTLNERTPFDKTLRRCRRSLLRQDREEMYVINQNGTIIKQVRGGTQYVLFDNDTALRLKDNTVIHNHPSGKYSQDAILQMGFSLSLDDLREAVRCNLKSIIAETVRYRYSANRIGKSWGLDPGFVAKRYSDVYNEISKDYAESFKEHTNYQIVRQHLTMKRLAKLLGFSYKYERL